MPRWRGALFSLVAAVLLDVHTVKQTSSRFGVLARVGECVARLLGREDGWFTEEYAKVRLELALEAGTADSVYLFLTDFLMGIDKGVGSKWVCTSTELFIKMKDAFADLSQLVAAKDFPGNARAISPRIV